ncbi:MAG: phosphoadenylyl-sulfate reductase [Bacteroidetes bacterium]|nr:phosphoadenylyl-sulfate reductase [Bacteroidota bacterium]
MSVNHNQLNGMLDLLPAEQRVTKIAEHFNSSRLAISSSFGTFSAGFLHLVTKIYPEIPVLFLDTGFHFEETLKFRDEVTELLGLNLINLKPAVSKSQLFSELGAEPFKSNPDRCCQVNKVDPMDLILNDYDLWISGIRSSQTSNRTNLSYLTTNIRNQTKFHPILDWTSKQVWDYLQEYELPVHPLFEKGFTSIGCEPCTSLGSGDADDRSGRWGGDKNECGLHL